MINEKIQKQYVDAINKEIEKYSIELYGKKSCDLTEKESKYLFSLLRIDVIFEGSIIK